MTAVSQFVYNPQSNNPATITEDLDGFNGEFAARIADVELFGDYVDQRLADASAQSVWVSGSSYTDGETVYSPTDGLPYKANKDIASSVTDPSADGGTDWNSAGGISIADQSKLDNITITEAVDLDATGFKMVRIADGSVTAGNTLVLNSDGTVSEVGSVEIDASVGTEYLSGVGGTSHFVTANVSNGFLIFVEDRPGASNDECWFVSMAGDVLTWTNELDFAGSVIEVNYGADTDGTDNCIATTFKDSSTTWGKLEIVAGAWDGSSITYGTVQTIYTNTGETNQATGGIDCLAYNPDLDNFCCLYNLYTGANTLYSVVISKSGTALTVNTPTSIVTAGNLIGLKYNTTYNKYIAVYLHTDSATAYVRIGTPSGTTVSWGSAITLYTRKNAGLLGYHLAYHPVEDAYVFIVNDYTAIDSGVVYCVGFTTDGSTISKGSEVNFSTGFCTGVKAVYDPISESMVCFHGGNLNAARYPSVFNFSMAGNTVTILSESAVVSSGFGADNYGILYEPTEQKLAVFYGSGTSGGFGGRRLTPYSLSTDIENWIGLAGNSASDTEAVVVKTAGDIDDNQTGLVIGDTYYLTNEGAKTTSVTSHKIGKAVAADKLYITERRP